MKKIGLALSGGGFRATLYHLGLARFLYDAGLLSSVTHISSVSGGSIFAAHLALNWDRYNGSSKDFDAAAAELLSFVRLDVRNRIVRRWLLAAPVNFLRRLCFMRANRRLMRVGLLEAHYQRYLFGDKLLSELPKTPQLHILATDLNEGGICSFNRNGALFQRRQADGTFRFQNVNVGLATVPMAVAASSAFPGFFPPIHLSTADVGASPGEFAHQTFTDGGIFDNLGVRLFRCLERSWLAEDPLAQNDFVDFEDVGAALIAAASSSEETPIRRVSQVLATYARQPGRMLLSNESAGESWPMSPTVRMEEGRNHFLSSFGDLLRNYPLNHEPLFAGLKLEDPHAQALLRTRQREGCLLDTVDQFWLNRHLVEAAFRLVTGRKCFRRLNSSLDGVLVSDVGKDFNIQSHASGGGLIQAALRSTDILMDRVWQLEKETFANTAGFTFAPVTSVVDQADDPTAMPAAVQRQVAKIRTDLDRFSSLEISSLVRHGYCVGHKACRLNQDVFGVDLPKGTVWQMFPPTPPVNVPAKTAEESKAPRPETVEARRLQASAPRRIFSTLLDYRDWVSYFFLPILGLLFFLLPYIVIQSYERSVRLSHLAESLSQSSQDLGIMCRLLDGTTQPWIGEAAEEIRGFSEPNYKGFEILQDSRIIDMRSWNPSMSAKNDSNSAVYGYRRIKIQKKPEHAGKNLFRLAALSTHPNAQLRFPLQEVQPKLHLATLDSTIQGEKRVRWEVSVDVSRMLKGEVTDLSYEHISPGEFLRRGPASTSIVFDFQVDTAEVTRWFLLPRGKEYRSFRILQWETDKPDKVEPVKVVNEYLADDYTILAYKLISVKAGYSHELTWFYK